MADKTMFVIPLTNANPFNAAISAGHAAGRRNGRLRTARLGNPDGPRPSGSRASTPPSPRGYDLIDLQGGLPAEMPGAADRRGAGRRRQGHRDPQLGRHDPERSPDFMDGAANTDYVTFGKIIAAWAIVQTGGKVNAIVAGPDEITADRAAARCDHQLPHGQLPGLQDDLHQRPGQRLGDAGPVGRPERAARRPDDQLRPAGLRLDVAVHRSGDPDRRLSGEDRFLQRHALRARHDARRRHRRDGCRREPGLGRHGRRRTRTCACCAASPRCRS